LPNLTKISFELESISSARNVKLLYKIFSWGDSVAFLSLFRAIGCNNREYSLGKYHQVIGIKLMLSKIETIR
jgi:hypothetical protein